MIWFFGHEACGFLAPWEVKVKVAQSCSTLCDPMDYTVHGILQARILEWVAFLFSRGSSQPRDRTQVSHIAGGFFTNWAMREPGIKPTPSALEGEVSQPLDCQGSLNSDFN